MNREDHAEILIRPYRLDDDAAFAEAARESAEAVRPWMPWCHAGYSSNEARAWVTRQVAAFAAGMQYEFLIVSGGGRMLGGCGLNEIERVNRRANLGYWVRSSEVRRGVASTAIRRLAGWTFRNTDLNRLELIVAAGNAASQAAARSAGAVREGVLRSRLLLHGQTHDAVVFSFIRGEPEEAGRPPDLPAC